MQKLSEVGNSAYMRPIQGKTDSQDIPEQEPARGLPPLVKHKGYPEQNAGITTKQVSPLVNDDRHPLLSNIGNDTPGNEGSLIYTQKMFADDPFGRGRQPSNFEHLKPFIVGMDQRSKGKDVMLIRPAQKNELLHVVDDKNHLIKGKRDYPDPVQNHQQEISSMSTKDLLKSIMPTLKQVSSTTHEDMLSELLRDIASTDSFVTANLTAAYLELQTRLPPNVLDDLLPHITSLDALKAATLEQLSSSELATLAASRDHRGRLGAPLLQAAAARDCDSFTAALDSLLADADHGEFRWLRLMALCKSKISVIYYLKENFKKDYESLIMGSEDYLKSCLERPLKEQREMLKYSSSMRHLVNKFVRSRGDLLASMMLRHDLSNCQEDLKTVLLDDHSLDRLKDLVLQDDFESYESTTIQAKIGAILKFVLPKVGADRVAEELSKRLIPFLNELAITSAMFQADRDPAPEQDQMVRLSKSSHEHFILNFVHKMPENAQKAVMERFVLTQSCLWLINDIDEHKLADTLAKLPKEDLTKLAMKVLPFEKIIELKLRALDIHSTNETPGNQRPSSTCWKKNRATSDDELAEDDWSGDEDKKSNLRLNSDQDSRLAKLTEPDPRLLEDYWLENDPASGLGIWPCLELPKVGVHPAALSASRYSLQLLTTAWQHADPPWTPFATDAPLCALVVDPATADVVAVLPGVYLAYAERYDLITFRLVDSADSPFKVDREVVIYDHKKLPELIVKEKYICGSIPDFNFEEIVQAGSYQSACKFVEMNNSVSVVLLYCRGSNECRGVVLKEGKYHDLPARIVFSQQVHTTQNC